MTDQGEKQRDILQFESGEYRSAFLPFRELFEKSSDTEERKMIFRLLSDGFYESNLESMQEQYEGKCCFLEPYPYRFGFQARRMENWPARLFPATETEYCLYNKDKQTFSDLQEITSSELRTICFGT